MVRIVVYDSDAVELAFILEPAVRTGEGEQPLLRNIHGNAEQVRHRDGGEGVGYIVVAGHGQGDVIRMLAVLQKIKSDMSVFIIGHIFCTVVRTRCGTIGDDIAVQSFINLLMIIYITVDDQRAVLRKEFRELAEGMTDVLQVFEEVEMILLDIQDHADLREEVKEAVGVFAGLCDKCLRTAHTDIASDGFQDATDRDGRIHIARKKDVGDHGCGRCLAMGSGYGDRRFIIRHQLPQEFRAGQHRDLSGNRFDEFRVGTVDGCGVDHAVDIRCDILRLLSVCDPCSFGFQLFRQCRLFGI